MSISVDGAPPGVLPPSTRKSMSSPRSRATSSGSRARLLAGAVRARAGHRDRAREQLAQPLVRGQAHAERRGAARRRDGRAERHDRGQRRRPDPEERVERVPRGGDPERVELPARPEEHEQRLPLVPALDLEDAPHAGLGQRVGGQRVEGLRRHGRDASERDPGREPSDLLHRREQLVDRDSAHVEVSFRRTGRRARGRAPDPPFRARRTGRPGTR